ncbi:hypothetical protein EWM64_g1479, partial [Hericium alpestre]
KTKDAPRTPPRPLDPPSDRPYLFDRLRKLDVSLLADTLHWDTLSHHKFNITAATPANVVERLQGDSELYYHLWVAVRKTIPEDYSTKYGQATVVSYFKPRVFQQFQAELGNALTDFVAGPHITFVDPREHWNVESMRQHANGLVSRLEKLGRHKRNIIVSPARRLDTGDQPGPRGARLLQREDGVKVNMALVSHVVQAAYCADAGAFSITVPVREMIDWHRVRTGIVYPNLHRHPAFVDIQTIAAYYRIHDIHIAVIGGSLDHEDEACPLAALDAIAFNQQQARNAEWYNTYPHMNAKLPDTAVRRARTVQRPQKFSSPQRSYNIAKVVSSETYSMIGAILYGGLGRAKAEMDVIDEIVERAIVQHLETQACLVERAASGRSSNIAKGKRKKEGTDTPTPPRLKKTQRVAEDERGQDRWFNSLMHELVVTKGYTDDEDARRPPTRQALSPHQERTDPVQKKRVSWAPSVKASSSPVGCARPERRTTTPHVVDPMDEVF